MATPIGDRTITQQVQGKIAGRGIASPCRVLVVSRGGEVTLTGSVQHAHQKGMAVQAAQSIAGVRRVVDQLIVKAVAKY